MSLTPSSAVPRTVVLSASRRPDPAAAAQSSSDWDLGPLAGPPEGGPRGPYPDAGRSRILIVEDEAVIALEIRHCLEQFGYAVVDQVASSEAALEALERSRPDLVLLDIRIKGPLDGVRTAELVHERTGTPVIFLSAFGDEDTVARASATGPYGFLVKPFQPQELRASIEVALFKHRMETRLRQSEQWLAKTLRCIADAVIATDASGRVKFANPAAEALTGWTGDGSLGRDVAEVVSLVEEADRRPRPNPAARAIASRAVVAPEGPALLLAKDGRETAIEGGAAPIFDDLGTLMGAALVLRDITERRRMERALRESEERFRSAFDHAATGMALVALDGRLVRVNDAARVMLGYSREELRSRTLLSLAHGDEAEGEAERRLLEDLLGGSIPSFQMERRFVHRSGEVRFTLLGVSAVRDRERRPLYLVAQMIDVTERRAAEARLAFAASHDPLTGALNRPRFVESLVGPIARARRRGRRVAALVIDVDDFKQVNDSFGHAVGDRLLTEAVARLKAQTRASDLVARFGGDEFVLAVTDVDDTEDVARIAQKSLDAIAQPFIVEGRDLLLTASAGVAVLPGDAEDLGGLLRCADDALYRAKELGKGNFQFYSADLTAQAVRRLRLEAELRRAIAGGDLALHYQPIVSGGRVVAAEALVRWNHAERGLLGADAFVPAAEDAGLIVPIGRFVLSSSCAQMKAWHDAGLTDARLSVNLSARQLRDPDLSTTVAGALEGAGLAPDKLELEITESSIMQDADGAAAVLRDLRELGVRVSVDDFGTGYSSLAYLKRLPLDGLKIDRSFVKDLPADADSVAIVEAIVGMARNLGLRVTAEGVETEEQRAFLEALRCDSMQGRLFSMPVPAEAFAGLLRGEGA